MASNASDCPKNILLTALKDSTFGKPVILDNPHPTYLINSGNIRKYVKTDNKVAKKIISNKTLKKKTLAPSSTAKPPRTKATPSCPNSISLLKTDDID